MPELSTDLISAHTRRWIADFVVAENLCPFAAPVLRPNPLSEPQDEPLLRIAVCDQQAEAELAQAVLNELDLLQRTPEQEVATSVLVFSSALTAFDDYLDFLGFAEELLAECGLEGVIQIASFHPDYVFDGVRADDPSHYSNRSPWPMLHFIREDQITRALQNHPDPNAIPERNIAHLRALGTPAISALLARIRSPQS